MPDPQNWSFIGALASMFNTVAIAGFAFWLGKLDHRVETNTKDINGLGNKVRYIHDYLFKK